jgi:apolipoprotein N-acyltransferase
LSTLAKKKVTAVLKQTEDWQLPQCSTIGIYFFLFYFIILLCWIEVHYGIFKGSYYVSNILEFTPLHHFLYPPLPHLMNSVKWYPFPFTFMCTQYLHHIPHLLPPSTGISLPRQNLFLLPVI